MRDLKNNTGMNLSNRYYDCLEQIRAEVMRQLDYVSGITEESVYNCIDDAIYRHKERYLDLNERLKIRVDIFNSIMKLDILQELLDDDSISEIMVNGYKDIFIERKGKVMRYDGRFSSEEKLYDVVHKIAAGSNKILNETVPIIDTHLPDGSRVNIVLPPISAIGPVITVRKFYNTPLGIERLIELGTLNEETADFLKNLVIAKYNIFISGGTSSGKTTFLNALSNFIPKNERIITIEDSLELKLQGIENLVRMETRSANMDGKNEISIRDMIKSSLRMRPDRIIVGEVRGGEVIDMLSAMNTGHDGSLSTGHANGPEEMLLRLETLSLMAMDMPVQAVRSQINSAIDIMIHLGRRRDGSRRLLSIAELNGIDEDGRIRLNILYEYRETANEEKYGELVRVNPIINRKKLEAANLSA